MRTRFRSTAALSNAKLGELRRRADETMNKLVTFIDQDEAGEDL